jgi:FkbM family methyltransferase
VAPFLHHGEVRIAADPELIRSNWFGLKPYAKRVLSLPPVNWLLIKIGRRFLPPLTAARLPVARKEVIGYVGSSTFVMLDPGRCTVAKGLYWGNGRLPRTESDMALRVFVGLASEADVVFDVGAYTGLFTVAALRANGLLHAHAFEIVPEIFALLVDNCARNDVLSRVTCHHVGLGNPAEVARVPASPGRSSLPSSYSLSLFKDGVRVRVDALDDHIPPIDSKVALKLDVEGSEPDVLENGRSFIGAIRPDIVSEVLMGADTARMESVLRPFGYRFWRIEQGHLAGPYATLDPHARFRDWLLTPRDVAAVASLERTVHSLAS